MGISRWMGYSNEIEEDGAVEEINRLGQVQGINSSTLRGSSDGVVISRFIVPDSEKATEGEDSIALIHEGSHSIFDAACKSLRTY